MAVKADKAVAALGEAHRETIGLRVKADSDYTILKIESQLDLTTDDIGLLADQMRRSIAKGSRIDES